MSAPSTADVKAGLRASIEADRAAWLAAALLKASRDD